MFISITDFNIKKKNDLSRYLTEFKEQVNKKCLLTKNNNLQLYISIANQFLQEIIRIRLIVFENNLYLNFKY